MWPIEQNSAFDFSSIEPEQVLVDYEGPQLFTFKQGKQTFLAYSSDDESNTAISRLLICVITDADLLLLKDGCITIFAILNRSILWALDWNQTSLKAENVVMLKNWLDTVPADRRPNLDSYLVEPKVTVWDFKDASNSFNRENQLFTEEVQLKLGAQEKALNSLRLNNTIQDEFAYFEGLVHTFESDDVEIYEHVEQKHQQSSTHFERALILSHQAYLKTWSQQEV